MRRLLWTILFGAATAVATVAATVAVALAAPAAFDSAKWTWKAPLSSPNGTAGFVRLSVSPEVFDRSRPRLEDLRVADEKGNLAPHRIVWQNGGETETVWRQVRLLNEAYQPREYARVTLDFSAPVEKNLLKVRVSGTNFRRKAMIEGGADGQTWDRVAENLYLFSVNLPGHTYLVDVLRLSPNNFQYLRLTVFQMDAEDSVRIEQVEAAFERPVEDLETGIPVSDAKVRWDEKKRETVVEMDLGFRNVPVTTVRMDVTDAYFHRPYVVEGRNAATEKVPMRTETGWDETEREAPWNHVHEGILYRYHDPGESATAECTSITRIRAPYRYLRVRFFEGDNPPLRIEPVAIAVFWRPPSLIFDRQPGKTYTLWGGNPKAASPNYDLAQAAPDVEPSRLPAASLGKLEFFGAKEPVVPWTETHGWLLTFLLVFAVVATGTVIMRSLRGVKGSSGS